MCPARLFLLLCIWESLPISILSSIAAGSVNVQTLTQFTHHDHEIYIYSAQRNYEFQDCRRWQFFYVPVVEPSYSSDSEWIWTTKNEIRLKIILGDAAIKKAAQQAISKKFSDEQVKKCSIDWDVSPLMIDSLTAYVIDGNREFTAGVFPYNRPQPNSLYLVCRFQCKDDETAEDVKNKILAGSLDIEILLQFDGFSTVKTNQIIINLNQVNLAGSKTINDGGNNNAKYVHQNQADKFVHAYVQNVKNVFRTEDSTNTTTLTMFRDIGSSFLHLFRQAFLEMPTISLNVDSYSMIWHSVDFDPDQFAIEINKIFKLSTTTIGQSNSNERYFNIERKSISRLTKSSSSILRPFWNELDMRLSTTKQQEIFAESKIKSILREQLIDITFIRNKLVPKTIGVLKILDVISRLQMAVISQQFKTEKLNGAITRTISTHNLNKNNHLLLYDHEWSLNNYSTILSPIDSTLWNCICSSIITVKKSLVDIEVLLGEDAKFSIVCDGDPIPKVKWFFANQRLNTSSKYSIRAINNTYTLTIFNCTNTDVGSYRVLIENVYERLELLSMLTLKMKPEIIGKTSKKEQVCMIGRDVEISWRFKGIETPRTTWLFNDKPLIMNERFEMNENEDAVSTLIIKRVQKTDTGVYTLLLKNNVGEVQAETSLDVVGNKPSIVTDLRGELRSTIGDDITLESIVVGVPTASLVWMKDDAQIIPNERIVQKRFEMEYVERWTLTIKNIQLQDVGTYWAKVENDGGSINSTKCRIIVSRLLNIPSNARWSSKDTVVIDSLSDRPLGLAIDQENGTIYVADTNNNRIVSWTPGEQQSRELVKNLNHPTNVLIDKENNSFIVADYRNRRVLRWSPQSDHTQVQTIINNIDCYGLAIDDEGALYTTDIAKNEVRRYPKDKSCIIAAGGNSDGQALQQLSGPLYADVDSEGAVYVSDQNNHRVVKWNRDAKKGIVVAGFEGPGSKKTQLHLPKSIVIDTNDNLYIADEFNNRVVRYRKNSKEADILIDSTQLQRPIALAFDRQYNLYVAVHGGRVIRFSIIE